MTDSLSLADRASDYIGRGWCPIPVPHKSKAPVLPRWPKMRIELGSVPDYFHAREGNIGVILGDPSSGLVDVDLDTPQAVMLAGGFLKRTCTFGRKTKPRSHWLYFCPEAATTNFKDTDGAMLLEIRSNGAQTVFPGSTHHSGELIEFDEDMPPVHLSNSELVYITGRLAAAALLARHWPAQGSRNETALALAGALIRGGWEPDVTEEFIVTVAGAAGDEEAEERGRCAHATFDKVEDGSPTTGANTLRRLLADEVVELLVDWLNLGRPVDDWVERMNDNYFVVNESGKAMIYQFEQDSVLRRETLIRYRFEDLSRLYANDKVVCRLRKNGEPVVKDRASAWLEHPQRRQYLGGVTFDPSVTTQNNKFNLWRGFAVTARAGSWEMLKMHIRDVICGGRQDCFEYLLGWLGRLFQQPGTQGEVAVVLQGGRGTGKGTLGNAVLRLFGQHGLYISNGRHLVGNFNAHLRDAVFVFVDEAFFAADRAHESVLKGLITEPYLTVEAKYQNATTVPNFTHILMASNENWVVPAGVDERRYLVLNVADTRKQDLAYFDAIRRELESGGYEAMLHDLLALDLRDFNVRRIPQTMGLAEQKVESLRGPIRWLFECLHAGAITSQHGLAYEWADQGVQLTKGDGHASYLEVAKRRHEYAAVDQGDWLKQLAQVLGSHIQETRPSALPQPFQNASGGAGARPRVVRFGSLQDCRIAFENHIGAPIQWPPDAETFDSDSQLASPQQPVVAFH